MVSTAGLILEDKFTDTLEQMEPVEFPLAQVSLALFRDEKKDSDFVGVTPDAVKSLVEANVKVFMQHGFGAAGGYDDMAYANVGAEFEDDFFQLSRMSHVLVKHTPFTASQLAMLQNKQLLITFCDAQSIDAEQLLAMWPKSISALAFDLIKDETGHCVLERLQNESSTTAELSVSVSNFLFPVLEELVLTPRLRFVLQKNPQLMSAVYCMDGIFCHTEMTERIPLPSRDIITLCWELN